MNSPRVVQVRRWKYFAATIAALIVTSSLHAQDNPPPKTSPVAISAEPLPVKVERAFPSLQIRRPILVSYPPDGTNRVAVISQYGSVLIFPNNQSVEEAQTLLDIQSKVTYKDRENEEGLLGLAFHPKFKDNRQFFLYYTTKDTPHVSVLSRFKVSANNPNVADPASEEEILRTPTKSYWNHNGGTIVFGPDGFLYIAIGDGGSANDPQANGQNISTWLGKVLRIDVDHQDTGKKYAVPKDNPFIDLPSAAPEIWALGTRNLWRMAFDRKTNKLWAGEVGQDLWEEINIIVRGGNYGWNIREAFHPFVTRPRANPPPGKPPEKVIGEFIDPVFEYHHDIGKSITGGGVYRGKKVPELVGKYLFADYVSAKVYALTYDEQSGKAIAVNPIEGNVMPVFSFGEDEAGEMYFTTTQGAIQQFRSAK